MTDKNQNDELDPTPDLDDADLEGASGGLNTDYSFCKWLNGRGNDCG
ncbi:MAG: hypothetical protein K0U31_06800 [Actinomycetia bacterium]|nr:hypothetical protein [Actinomycetes bacterium]MCH9831290.1 hypothetical protein [Actinomycetes bacterium]MCH9840890.1 hypothetical protein [Actinomycetes bacterium]